MIPIRDTIQSRNYPLANTFIIALNCFIFFIEMAQGPLLGRFIFLYGLVPARYSNPDIASYFSLSKQILSLFSFMFIHGGFWHLLGNMWSLYIFGDNIEDRLGPFRYILFYLLCGWISGFAHLFINWHSNVPTIGASGAIAGVMGAYFILYPKSRILTLIPIIIIPYFIEIPAFFFLGIWFIIQFINAAGAQAQTTGVAWWAHIGGFIAGVVFLKLFLKIPSLGLTEKFRRKTPKRKTPRLRVIKASETGDERHLYGTLSVTTQEARRGTKKRVNIPWGFRKRLIRVTVPPGVSHGTKLRIKGMGKRAADGSRGDLFLKVIIHSWDPVL